MSCVGTPRKSSPRISAMAGSSRPAPSHSTAALVRAGDEAVGTGHAPAQGGEGDRAQHERDPEEDETVGQHGGGRGRRRGAEDDEGADEPAVEAAEATRAG